MEKQTNILGMIFMLIAALSQCFGQLVWKLMPDYNLIYILGGFLIYFSGSIFMILAFRNGELSVLQPINSMSYVFATIIAFVILKEEIPPINIMGVCLIVTGVIIIGRNR